MVYSTSSATARSSQQGPATTAVPTSIVWSMGSEIVNAEELKAWHKKKLDAVRLPVPEYNGSSAELSSKFNPRSGEMPNGNAAWDGMRAKYQILRVNKDVY